ncbi:MAG: hypothetical protein PCFJNLEI_01376 [Verrucomicrobiae bacterium]|nr:hypothetical protein [Verrucomicrobiae bacterium]
MTTTLEAISASACARCGHSRSASSNSSPTGRRWADSTHVELRRFLGQLFFPQERIFFFPRLSETIYRRHLADPSAMAALTEWGLIVDYFDRRTCEVRYRPSVAPNPKSTRLDSGRFDSIIDQLLELNKRFGYDIFVCPNPLAFGRLCDRTIRGARTVVLEGGENCTPRWLDWLARHRQHVLASVDCGDIVQVCMRINPIRNHECIRSWKSLPEEGEDTSVELPEFYRIAHLVEELAQRDGLNPDHEALRQFSGLVRCPGFVNNLTGQLVRMLPIASTTHDVPIVHDAPVADAADSVAEATRATASEPPKVTASRPRRRAVMKPQPMLFYVKIDAAEVLSKPFRRYADQANYIQHRILMGRLLGDLDETATYTLLKSDYLRQVVHADLLKPLLTEMQTVGLIERDNHYIVGEKSYGYRFCERHVHAPTVRVGCRRAKFGWRIKSLRHQDFRHYKAVHKHLFGWLDRLTIDQPSAQSIISIADGADWTMPVNEVCDMHRLAVQAIAERQWEFKVCDYGRVHTNVTRLLHGLRGLLRIDGQQLVTIDVANSQPLFLLAALLTASDSVAKAPKGVPKGGFRCRKAPSRSFAPYTTSFYPQKTTDEAVAKTSPYPPDLEHYRRLCESGGLYQYLMERLGWTAGKQAFKDEEVFRCLYGTNGDRDAAGKYNPSRLQPMLESDFPTVWHFITDWKGWHGYRDLACQMQRAESRLMIEGVCGRLMRTHPDCPLVTIHDSIMTTPAWVEIVRGAILEEFDRIGIQPTLHVE